MAEGSYCTRPQKFSKAEPEVRINVSRRLRLLFRKTHPVLSHCLKNKRNKRKLLVQKPFGYSGFVSYELVSFIAGRERLT